MLYYKPKITFSLFSVENRFLKCFFPSSSALGFTFYFPFQSYVFYKVLKYKVIPLSYFEEEHPSSLPFPCTHVCTSSAFQGKTTFAMAYQPKWGISYAYLQENWNICLLYFLSWFITAPDSQEYNLGVFPDISFLVCLKILRNCASQMQNSVKTIQWKSMTSQFK